MRLCALNEYKVLDDTRQIYIISIVIQKKTQVDEYKCEFSFRCSRY